MRSSALLIILSFCLLNVVSAWGEASGKESEDGNAKKVFEELERNLSEIETVQARFVQEKHMAMFDRKMIIEGRLTVANPDRIAWHVEKPVRYRMVISGHKLKQWDEDTDDVQTLRLDKNPSLEVAFEQFTAWFSGKYASLRRRYDVTIETYEPLVLFFEPKKGSEMEAIIRRVEVGFRGDRRYIERLKIFQGNGDVTIIRFLETRLNEDVAEEVWRVRPDE